MRRVQVTVPPPIADAVGKELSERAAEQVERWEAERGGDPVVHFTAVVTNRRLEGVMTALARFDEARLTFAPQGTLAVDPSSERAIDRSTADVSSRSPVEVVLDARQSTGSWKGFLAYAVSSAVVAWVGLTTDTWFLLTAAMLIAPFAEPAMNAAIATARGLPGLLLQGVGRYAVAIGVSILTSAALTWALGVNVPTALMGDIGTITAFTALLPLVAGVAGAANLSLPDRASLVTGAAPGVLVAASLAPPAALVGAALVMGEGALATTAGFLLALQLCVLHLAATAVFRIAGLGPGDRPYAGGARRASIVAVGVALTAAAALLGWQASSSPLLRRASLAAEAEQEVVLAVRARPDARIVDVEARFARTAGEPDVLVVTGLVVPPAGADPEAYARELSREVQPAVGRGGTEVLVRLDAVTP